jgi:hypothetical protein
MWMKSLRHFWGLKGVLACQALNDLSTVDCNKSKNRIYQTRNALLCKGNNQVKRQPTDWDYVFPNHIPEKRQIPKIYNECLQSITKKLD